MMEGVRFLTKMSSVKDRFHSFLVSRKLKKTNSFACETKLKLCPFITRRNRKAVRALIQDAIVSNSLRLVCAYTAVDR